MILPEYHKIWRLKNKDCWKKYCENYRKLNRKKIRENTNKHYKTFKRQNYLKNYSMQGKALSEKQKIIYNMYYNQHMSCSEIAGILNVTQSCITGHLYKIKQKLELPKHRGKRV